MRPAKKVTVKIESRWLSDGARSRTVPVAGHTQNVKFDPAVIIRRSHLLRNADDPVNRACKHRRTRALRGWFSVVGAVLALVVLALAFPGSAAAAPLRVRVRGSAKLSLRASRDLPTVGERDVILSGTLTDDIGEPLARRPVGIRVVRKGNPADPHVVENLRNARGCDGAHGASSEAAHVPEPPLPARRGAGTERPRAGADNEVIPTTDEDGRFCFRARLEPDLYEARAVYAPETNGSLLDGSEQTIAFDLSRRGLALRFDPVPRTLQLDPPLSTIDVVALVDDDGAPRVASALSIVLANENEELARATTDETGRARFVVGSAKLGAPGRGELHVSFAGDTETAIAASATEVERHVGVHLAAPGAEARDARDPEDGIPLTIQVTTALGPVNEGSVEARIGTVVIGTAPVANGAANLIATFSSQGDEARVSVRYVPASPWLEATTEPTIRLPIRGPSLWSKIPVLAAGLAVLAFFLVGRAAGRTPNVETDEGAGANARPREAKPRLEVVRAAERGAGGWTGRVVDAHDGVPVRGARVWVERGTFEGRTMLASVETDESGRFAIAAIEPTVGDETISVEARFHSRLTQSLPAPGDVAIAIVGRRRAVLARLVDWARRRGGPFDVRPEATPGHVRKAAAGDPPTTRWAEAVERAAFGPDDVDAIAEQEIERLVPAAPGTAAADDRTAAARDLRPRDLDREGRERK